MQCRRSHLWKQNAIKIKQTLILEIILSLLALKLALQPIEVEAEVVIIEKTWQDEFAKLPQELQKVAKCESGLDINAKNPKSTASGLFQIIDGTFKWVWLEIYDTPIDLKKKNDPFVQIEMAKWIYANYGLSQWQFPCGTLK